MLGLIPVRGGELPSGALEVVAECGGRVVLAGSAPDAGTVAGWAGEVWTLELGDYDPGHWAARLAALGLVEGADVVVLPASPDGRDLAPHLARALGRPLHANAVTVATDTVVVVRGGGLALLELRIEGPCVTTLQPGVRGVEPPGTPAPAPTVLAAPDAPATTRGRAEVLAVRPPDVETMDLAEADRIVGGGAGLDDGERFTTLRAVGRALGASMGATRVITDRGWVGHERQIGTTGVVVDPDLYLAFGISGAVQHTAGLGTPEHIISVNTDPHCPMMQLADLAVVADANATLDHLADLLGVAAEVAT